MVDEELDAALQRIDEAPEDRVVPPVGAGHDDQLVVGRHAVLLDVEGAAGPALQLHLVQFEIAVGADHRIDLPRQQRGREREVDVDQGHVLHADAVRFEHGAEQRVLEAADREADGAALQVGERRDRAVVQHQQRVERRRHQGRDAQERQALVHLDVELGLIGDRQIGLAGGHQLRRVVRIRRRDDLQVDPGLFEIALLERDEDRRVVRVHEPVEQKGERLGRRARARRQSAGRETGADGNGESGLHDPHRILPVACVLTRRPASRGRGAARGRRGSRARPRRPRG